MKYNTTTAVYQSLQQELVTQLVKSDMLYVVNINNNLYIVHNQLSHSKGMEQCNKTSNMIFTSIWYLNCLKEEWKHQKTFLQIRRHLTYFNFIILWSINNSTTQNCYRWMACCYSKELRITHLIWTECTVIGCSHDKLGCFAVDTFHLNWMCYDWSQSRWTGLCTGKQQWGHLRWVIWTLRKAFV